MARRSRIDSEVRANRRRTRIIRRKNDAYRRDLVKARVLITPCVRNLAEQDLRALLLAVRDYRDFAPIYDPFREHDGGGINLGGRLYFWQIEYFDPADPDSSPDPTDDSTCRMITIRRADEA